MEPAPTLPPCCTPTDDASHAEVAYCAYNAAGDPATAGLNYAGKPCPTWAELPENVRAKWEAAAEAAPSATLDTIREAATDLGKELGVSRVHICVAAEGMSVPVGHIDIRRDDEVPPLARLFQATQPAEA